MDAAHGRDVAEELARAADRLDALAEVAELMDDEATARRFRHEGERCRMQAMTLLDD